MSWALAAFAPAGGRRRIRSRCAGVAQQVGQVRGAARELPHLRRAVQVVAERRRRARAASRPPPRRRRRPPRGPAGSRRRVVSRQSPSVQLGGLAPHQRVVRRPVGCLSAHASRAGGSGTISSSPRVEPGEHRGGDVVGGDRRALDQLRSPPRRAPRRRRAARPSGWCGSTTGRRRCARTPYAASSWPVVSVSATTAALTALYDAIPAGCTSPASEATLTIVARALPLEQRHEGAGAADHPEQVDLGDPLPLVERGDVEPAAAGDAGVVDQHVEAAPASPRRAASAAAQSSSEVMSSVEVDAGLLDREVGRQHLVPPRPEGPRQRGTEPDAAPVTSTAHRAAAVLAELEPGDHAAVHLVGPVGEPQRPGADPRRRRAGSRRTGRRRRGAGCAMSMTCCAMFGHRDLDLGDLARARSAGRPTSSFQAASSTSSRAWSMAIRASAMRSRLPPRLASGLPNAVRSRPRRQASSSASSASPISRMQWCTRPGPSRPWAIAKPSPGPEMTLASGTRTSVNDTSPWPSGSS